MAFIRKNMKLQAPVYLQKMYAIKKKKDMGGRGRRKKKGEKKNKKGINRKGSRKLH